ncbi:hypothetical protein FHS96_001836 [Sphingomonas zeicaulis]|uniref:hypothetical protein n=1 Tax=Sphingomonas zeicaulis TaxID=1632740 RepID=UPI003D2003A0
MTRLLIAGVPAALLLAGCTTGGPPPAVTPPPPVARPAVPAPIGLERVMGKDARNLVALFGNPDQDTREPGARRLQFAGPICILDAYLYPPAKGQEPVVTYVDARQPNGRDIDRASCVAALTRRPAAQ